MAPCRTVFMSPGEQKMVAESLDLVPERLRSHTYLEIGAGVGGSTRLIASHLARSGRGGRLVTIDSCAMGREKGKEWVIQHTGGETEDQAEAIVGSVDGYDSPDPNHPAWAPVKHVLYNCDSGHPAAVCDPGLQSLAWLLIDGDHSYGACLADLIAWASCVAPGGILAIHDVGWKCSYVMMAVRDWLPLGLERWAWWGQADSLLVLRRAPLFRPANLEETP